MAYQSPSEDDFNAHWITPEEALGALNFSEATTKWRWIMDRLKTGLIVAFARTGDQTGMLERFPIVPPQLWRSWDEYGTPHFWETGDALFI